MQSLKMSDEIRSHVLQLMKQKEKIEDEIKQLIEILTLVSISSNIRKKVMFLHYIEWCRNE